MIRQATRRDATRLTEMGARFITTTSYGRLIAFDRDKATDTVLNLIDSPDGVVLVAEDEKNRVIGMIGLLLYDHLYSGERSAFELFWWVEPEARNGSGVRLLRAAELEAKKRAAVACYMIAPDDQVEKLGKMYDRLGYRAVETSYQRRL